MTYWVLLVRVLPPVAFTIPLYTMFSTIGLLNTKIPVTLACVLINVPLIIWFLISFFQDLPEEVEESAKVDGATEWQLFRKIVLPLVAPGIAAVAMLSFMYAWNEYTYTVIFTRSPSNYTVPLALSVLNTEDNLTNFGLVAAGGVVSVIPITLFVIFAQNYLISGLSSGAVKEELNTSHFRSLTQHQAEKSRRKRNEKTAYPGPGAGHDAVSGGLRRRWRGHGR